MISKKRSIKQIGYSLVSNFFSNITGSCPVLLYHRICKLNNDHLLLSVTPDNFYEHVAHLKKDFRILKAEEFKDIVIRKRKFPPRSVLLTFDDGYADNYFNALPILESLNAEAIFFIATGFIDRQVEFWWDKLDNILIQHGIIIREIKYKDIDIKIKSEKDCIDAFDLIFPLLRNSNVAERDKVINEWASKANIKNERDEYRPMTWDELKQFSNSASVVLGGHTVNHPSLGSRSVEEQKFEIEHSKMELERKLNKEILFFSYPFGQANDFTQETMEICKDVGYEIVFANYPVAVTIASKRYCLPRFVIRDWNISEFKRSTSSLK